MNIANPLSEEKKFIKLGILGSGSRGVSNFCQNLAENFGRFEMLPTTLCDIYPERLKEAGDRVEQMYNQYGHNIALTTTCDYKEVIDDVDIDAVVIVTPQFCHKEPALYAMEKNKFFVCDKPLAHSLDDAEEIYQSWLAKNKPSGFVTFTRRFENAWIRAKQIIDQGWIGDVKMMQIKCVIPYRNYFHRWHGLKEFSGDLLNEKCSHLFDAFNWFAESKAAKISAMGGVTTFTPREAYPDRCLECQRDCPYRESYSTTVTDQTMVKQLDNVAMHSSDRLLMRDKCVYSPENDIIDHAIVNMAYRNGIKAQLFFSVAGPHSESQECFEVTGEKGVLRLIRHAGRLEVSYNYGQENMVIDARGENHQGSHFGADLHMLGLLANAIRTECQPEAGIEEAYIATKMAHYAHESIKTDKVYSID